MFITNPIEHQIRRELTSIVDLCVRGGPPFARLRALRPFDTYPAKIDGADPALRARLEDCVIASAKFMIGGEEFRDRAAAEELHRFYSQAIKGWVPEPVVFDPRVSAVEAERIVARAVQDRLPGFRPCKLPVKLPGRTVRGHRIVVFGEDLVDGRTLLIALDPSNFSFAVYLGLSDPFFGFSIGEFWGLGNASWTYQTERELMSGLAIALAAAGTLLPLVRDAMLRGLE